MWWLCYEYWAMTFSIGMSFKSKKLTFGLKQAFEIKPLNQFDTDAGFLCIPLSHDSGFKTSKPLIAGFGLQDQYQRLIWFHLEKW